MVHVKDIALFRKNLFVPGSVIVITGGGSGIGKNIALTYAKRPGVKLVLADMNKKGLEASQSECQKLGAACDIFVLNVTEPEECKNLMAFVINKYSKIDVLVLCAGIGAHHTFEKTHDFALYKKLMDVNFYGYLYCVKFAHPHLIASKGHLVAITSFSGEVGLPYRTGYCASKFAVTGFLEALRAEMYVLKRSYDITIVCPPTVNSNLRKNSLSDESMKAAQAEKKGGEGIDVKQCAEAVVDASDRRLRKVFFPLSSFVGAYLRPLVPQLMDKMIFDKASAL